MTEHLQIVGGNSLATRDYVTPHLSPHFQSVYCPIDKGIQAQKQIFKKNEKSLYESFLSSTKSQKMSWRDSVQCHKAAF